MIVVPPTYLQLHQPLGGEADHLAQQLSVRALFQERAKVHHLVGHRWFLESGCVSQPDLTGESSMTDREGARSLQRYGGALARGFATASYTTNWDPDPLFGAPFFGQRLVAEADLCDADL
jgi:hypothetical protein